MGNLKTMSAETIPPRHDHIVVQLTVFESDHPYFYALLDGLSPRRRARKIRSLMEERLTGDAAGAATMPSSAGLRGTPVRRQANDIALTASSPENRGLSIIDKSLCLDGLDVAL